MCEKKKCVVTKRTKVCVQRRVVPGFELVKVQSFMKNVIQILLAGSTAIVGCTTNNFKFGVQLINVN